MDIEREENKRTISTKEIGIFKTYFLTTVIIDIVLISCKTFIINNQNNMSQNKLFII